MESSYIKSKSTVHVEVCLRNLSDQQRNDNLIKSAIKEYISLKHKVPLNVTINMQNVEVYNMLPVASVMFECEAKKCHEFVIANENNEFMFHMYFPTPRGSEIECFEDDVDSNETPASNHWLLPTSSFNYLWENLIYEDGLKEKLLRFSLTALTFGEMHVNPNIICCNRLILLHGPPGTGKTSLCKALAQKISIRAKSKYEYTHLVEINSHSLFSKWFSESGKLVMKLFTKIRDLTTNPKSLVCILIDEVESLAYARDSMSGQEPKDALRVVNALLTQLDNIKECPNVLIFATSNLTNCIDLAFIDRTDVKQFIGMPSISAIKRIYETIIVELMRVGIIRRESLSVDDKHEGLLNALAERSVGISGRTLRKLPFLAHAIYSKAAEFGFSERIWLTDFLDNLLAALEQHLAERNLVLANKELKDGYTQ